jgi:hypothetical protein
LSALHHLLAERVSLRGIGERDRTSVAKADRRSMLYTTRVQQPRKTLAMQRAKQAGQATAIGHLPALICATELCSGTAKLFHF